jgi:hypothetical protein
MLSRILPNSKMRVRKLNWAWSKGVHLTPGHIKRFGPAKTRAQLGWNRIHEASISIRRPPDCFGGSKLVPQSLPVVTLAIHSQNNHMSTSVRPEHDDNPDGKPWQWRRWWTCPPESTVIRVCHRRALPLWRLSDMVRISADERWRTTETGALPEAQRCRIWRWSVWLCP